MDTGERETQSLSHTTHTLTHKIRIQHIHVHSLTHTFTTHIHPATDLVAVVLGRGDWHVEHGGRDTHAVGNHGRLSVASDVTKVIVSAIVVIHHRDCGGGQVNN